MQDSKEREYIGKIEPDGPVVLRVVLSDSIPSDHQQLIQAVRVRMESVLAELEQQSCSELGAH